MSKRDDLVLLKDIKTQDAVACNLQIIGEAIRNLSPDLKLKYKKIPWPKIIGLRHKLVHDYSGIDYDLIWQILEDYLPELSPQIERAIRKETK